MSPDELREVVIYCLALAVLICLFIAFISGDDDGEPPAKTTNPMTFKIKPYRRTIREWLSLLWMLRHMADDQYRMPFLSFLYLILARAPYQEYIYVDGGKTIDGSFSGRHGLEETFDYHPGRGLEILDEKKDIIAYDRSCSAEEAIYLVARYFAEDMAEDARVRLDELHR